MKTIAAILGLATLAPSSLADEHSADLAKQLSDPVASLISAPFLANYDFGMGPTNNGSKFTLNLQPVVPFSISRDWNIIVRTILPLISHQESFTAMSRLGDSERKDIGAMFLQPFVSYATKTHTSLTLNAQSTYIWDDSQWTVIINAAVSQILKNGKQPVSIQLVGRYYAEGPNGAPE